jgi:DNA-binding GntR family transcriptional regulator
VLEQWSVGISRGNLCPITPVLHYSFTPPLRYRFDAGMKKGSISQKSRANGAEELQILPRKQNWENAEAVHDELRAAILRNELPAGMILNQVHVAKRLGVSRTPLREAFRMLQREGLIEGESNKRMRVAGLSLDGLEDLYAMRILLEGLAIRLSVPLLTEAALSALEKLLQEMEKFAQMEDYEAWEVPHRKFHTGLVQCVGERQRREIMRLSEHAERYRRAYTTEAPRAWAKGAKEHRAILDACIGRDPVSASERLARHYSSVVLGLLGMLAPEHEPVAVRTAMRMLASLSS